MSASSPAQRSAIVKPAEAEWQANAHEDWGVIDFWHWPWGLYRSAWVVAGGIRWNPLEVFDASTPAAHAVNVVLTWQCVIFTIVMTRHTPHPQGAVEPLLAWFSAAAHDHQQDISDRIKGLASVDWGLPDFRRLAACQLVRMWEHGGAAVFRDLSASLPNRPTTL